MSNTVLLKTASEPAAALAPVRAYIGLGSNLAQPLTQLQTALTALAALPHCHDLLGSKIVRNKALAGMDQPDYYNAVAALTTTLSARELLTQLHAIEAAQGRVRTQHWGARTLDLDLLLYGNECQHEADLVLPHYALTERAFVVFPLLQIAPTLSLPDGRTLQSVAQTLDQTTLEWLAS